MNLKRNSANGYRNKKIQSEADSRTLVPSNVIPVNRETHAAWAKEIISSKLDSGKKSGQTEAVVSLQGTSKLGFIILGFVFGLLISVAVLILYEMDNIVSPVEAKSEIAGRMKEIENNFARKLQIIQQQREADLEKNRSIVWQKESNLARTAALQRDRDAALAIAKARTELLQEKLEAELAAQKERRATTEKVSLEFARVAARLKAKLSRQQKTEAEQAAVKVSKAASTSLEQGKQSVADKNRAGFRSNPCDGPTAVLLASCKK
ncbi:MAG: hypothetical protein GXP11_11065 [Gammaproteobacteria bacterium]|nr:hypothetical protein [Gammaproteobacteria bacterium]